jgi:hypothetical protein
MEPPVIEVEFATKRELAKLTTEVQEFDILNYFLAENIDEEDVETIHNIVKRVAVLRDEMIPKLARLETVLASANPDEMRDGIARLLRDADLEEATRQRILGAIDSMGGVAAAVSRARGELEGLREAHAEMLKALEGHKRPSAHGVVRMKSIVACAIACALLVLGIMSCVPCGVTGAALGAVSCF